MEYGAIDLHKKERQIRIVTTSGEVIDQRIATTRERLTHVFWCRPRMRVLVEASTESEWVAQHLEQMGHDVIVADPNYGPMYGHRSRRIKNGSPRRRRSDGSLSPRHVSTRASPMRTAARGAMPVECPSGTDTGAYPGDFADAEHHPRGRPAHSQRAGRNISHAARGARHADIHESDAVTVAECHRNPR
jgi:hypothetical protein